MQVLFMSPNWSVSNSPVARLASDFVSTACLVSLPCRDGLCRASCWTLSQWTCRGIEMEPVRCVLSRNVRYYGDYHCIFMDGGRYSPTLPLYIRNLPHLTHLTTPSGYPPHVILADTFADLKSHLRSCNMQLFISDEQQKSATDKSSETPPRPKIIFDRL